MTSPWARAHGLPVVNRGHCRMVSSSQASSWSAACSSRRPTNALVADLDSRGLLFAHVPYRHSYPHCWRCHTPLMYYAQPSWYIRTTAIKDQLLAQNDATSGFPRVDQVRTLRRLAEQQHRLGALAQPLLGNPAANLAVRRQPRDRRRLTSRARRAWPDNRSHDIDPHRPFVDDVVLPCQECGAEARRVPEVADVWFDSGCMPFAQWGYPHHQSEADFRAQYPADYICEAIDQTRGWFYTLMTVGTLVFDESSYRNGALPWPPPGQGGPQDEQAPRQRPRPHRPDGRARR